MRLILSIYEHRVMMHVKFHEDIVSLKKLLLFVCLNFNEFFHPQS